jgi:hypothetical protein
MRMRIPGKCPEVYIDVPRGSTVDEELARVRPAPPRQVVNRTPEPQSTRPQIRTISLHDAELMAMVGVKDHREAWRALVHVRRQFDPEYLRDFFHDVL